MKQKKSVEDYLKTIYILSCKGNRRFATDCLRVLKGTGGGRVYPHG